MYVTHLAVALATIFFFIAPVFSTEINVSCLPSYVLDNGKFDHDISEENIYIRYIDNKLVELSAPFNCDKQDSILQIDTDELVFSCYFAGVILTSVTINRHTGAYKRFTQLLESKPLRYTDVAGTCKPRDSLF